MIAMGSKVLLLTYANSNHPIPVATVLQRWTEEATTWYYLQYRRDWDDEVKHGWYLWTEVCEL